LPAVHYKSRALGPRKRKRKKKRAGAGSGRVGGEGKRKKRTKLTRRSTHCEGGNGEKYASRGREGLKREKWRASVSRNKGKKAEKEYVHQEKVAMSHTLSKRKEKRVGRKKG